MHYESLITTAVTIVTAVLSVGILLASPGIEITGPATYSMYVVGQRTFLLLGDYHVDRAGACEGPAPTIADWLMQVLTTTKEVVDVYLEIYKGVEIGDTGYMKDIVDKLGACVKPGGCGMPRTRVHYVDVRSDPNGPLIEYTDMLEKLVYPEIFGTYTGPLPEPSEFAKFLRTTHGTTKTSKQLAMVQDPSIATAIVKFYDDRQADIVGGRSSREEKFLDLLSLEMDLYALGRMFKTAKDGSTSTRNIVYAGEFHTDNYERFLGAVGRRVCGQTVRLGPDGPVRCVKLDSRVSRAFA